MFVSLRMDKDIHYMRHILDLACFPSFNEIYQMVVSFG